jgi:hypothetical protein
LSIAAVPNCSRLEGVIRALAIGSMGKPVYTLLTPPSVRVLQRQLRAVMSVALTMANERLRVMWPAEDAQKEIQSEVAPPTKDVARKPVVPGRTYPARSRLRRRTARGGQA